MTTSIRLPQDTLREMLESIDEVVKFTEYTSADLNITTVDGSVLIYVISPGMDVSLVHELIPSDDVQISVDDNGERICLNPNDLRDVVRKAEGGTIEIEFLDYDYVVRYEEDDIFSEPLTLRLKRFVETEFEEPPRVGELKRIGSLDRVTLSRALNVMSTISPVVQVSVNSGMLSLQVKDKVSGEGEVSPKLTNSEIGHFEAWYSIDPPIRFLRRITSGENVHLLVTSDNTLVLEVNSTNKNSRLYLAERVREPG